MSTIQIIGLVVAGITGAFGTVEYLDTLHAPVSVVSEIKSLSIEITLERLYREENDLLRRLSAYRTVYGRRYEDAPVEIEQEIAHITYRLEIVQERIRKMEL